MQTKVVSAASSSPELGQDNVVVVEGRKKQYVGPHHVVSRSKPTELDVVRLTVGKLSPLRLEEPEPVRLCSAKLDNIHMRASHSEQTSQYSTCSSRNSAHVFCKEGTWKHHGVIYDSRKCTKKESLPTTTYCFSEVFARWCSEDDVAALLEVAAWRIRGRDGSHRASAATATSSSFSASRTQNSLVKAKARRAVGSRHGESVNPARIQFGRHKIPIPLQSPLTTSLRRQPTKRDEGKMTASRNARKRQHKKSSRASHKKKFQLENTTPTRKTTA